MDENFLPVEFNQPKGKFYGFGIASMILGIISITCCCVFGAPILFAILAVVFAIITMSKGANGFAIAGLVTGCIGVILNGIVLMIIFGGGLDIYLEELESVLESLEESLDVIRLFVIR